MGRKKIAIKLIDRDSIRNATFEKRKVGVLKKAMELSILCDCEVSVTINRRREDNDLLLYASDPYDQIIDNYHNYRGEYRLYKNEHIENLIPGKVSSRSVGYLLNKTTNRISNTRTVRVGDAVLPLDVGSNNNNPQMDRPMNQNLMMPMPGYNVMMPQPGMQMMMPGMQSQFMPMYNLLPPLGGAMANPGMMMNRMQGLQAMQNINMHNIQNMQNMQNQQAQQAPLRMLIPSQAAVKLQGMKRTLQEMTSHHERETSTLTESEDVSMDKDSDHPPKHVGDESVSDDHKSPEPAQKKTRIDPELKIVTAHED